MAQHFDIAAHRKFFHGEQHLHTLRLHLRPTDTDKTHAGYFPFECAHQVAAEQITRGFAGNYTYCFGLLGHGET